MPNLRSVKNLDFFQWQYFLMRKYKLIRLAISNIRAGLSLFTGDSLPTPALRQTRCDVLISVYTSIMIKFIKVAQSV